MVYIFLNSLYEVQLLYFCLSDVTHGISYKRVRKNYFSFVDLSFTGRYKSTYCYTSNIWSNNGVTIVKYSQGNDMFFISLCIVERINPTLIIDVLILILLRLSGYQYIFLSFFFQNMTSYRSRCICLRHEYVGESPSLKSSRSLGITWHFIFPPRISLPRSGVNNKYPSQSNLPPFGLSLFYSDHARPRFISPPLHFSVSPDPQFLPLLESRSVRIVVGICCLAREP